MANEYHYSVMIIRDNHPSKPNSEYYGFWDEEEAIKRARELDDGSGDVRIMKWGCPDMSKYPPGTIVDPKCLGFVDFRSEDEEKSLL